MLFSISDTGDSEEKIFTEEILHYVRAGAGPGSTSCIENCDEHVLT